MRFFAPVRSSPKRRLTGGCDAFLHVASEQVNGSRRGGGGVTMYDAPISRRDGGDGSGLIGATLHVQRDA